MKPRRNTSTTSLLTSTAFLGVVALLLLIALRSPSLGVSTHEPTGQRGGIAPAQETPDPTATTTPDASATPTTDPSATPNATTTATPIPMPVFVPYVSNLDGSARHVDVPTATTVPTY